MTEISNERRLAELASDIEDAKKVIMLCNYTEAEEVILKESRKDVFQKATIHIKTDCINYLRQYNYEQYAIKLPLSREFTKNVTELILKELKAQYCEILKQIQCEEDL